MELLSAGAQQRLGLVIDMGNHTIYSRTLKELELIVHNGLIVLPSIALPGEPGLGNIVLNTEEQHDIRHTFQNDDAISDDETIQYDMALEDENYKVNKGGSDYMPITEGKVEISTCNFKNPWTKWRTVP